MKNIYQKYEHIASLDSAKLDQLVVLGKDIDEDVLGQLLVTHQDITVQILKEMLNFYDQKNSAELKRCAHKFKSSCANLGLMRLNKLCADFESYLTQAAESINFNDVKDFIECIQFEDEQTNLQLNSYQKVA